MEIMIFGHLIEITRSKSIDAPCAKNIAELRHNLEEMFPGLVGKTFVIAVNNQLETEEYVLSQNDRLALLPPFSGG